MTGEAPPERLRARFTEYLALSHIIAVPVDSPLAPLPGEAAEEAPAFYVARATWGETYVAIRLDVAPALRHDLAALAPARALSDHSAVLALFDQHGAACDAIWLGRTARFPEDLDPALADGVVALEPRLDAYGLAPPASHAGEAPVGGTFVTRQFAIITDGLVVATCESSRESGVGAEAWVRTLPAYRGRGYARRVTAAWARDVRSRSKEPYYSHHRDNQASAAVARALGLIPFLEDVGVL